MNINQKLEAENEKLREAIKLLTPCASAAEISLRAEGLCAAADKCIAALDNANDLLGIPRTPAIGDVWEERKQSIKPAKHFITDFFSRPVK